MIFVQTNIFKTFLSISLNCALIDPYHKKFWCKFLARVIIGNSGRYDDHNIVIEYIIKYCLIRCTSQTDSVKHKTKRTYIKNSEID